MRLRLPKAKYAKHVVEVRRDGTSGWDWVTPNDRNPFLSNPDRGVDLDAGDVILNYEEAARTANKRVAIYAVLDGPFLVNYASAASDQFWHDTLAPTTRDLLRLPRFARCCWLTDILLRKVNLSNWRDPGAGLCVDAGCRQSLINQLQNLRNLYTNCMNSDGVPIDDVRLAYVQRSWQEFVIRHAEISGLPAQMVAEQCTPGIAFASVLRNEPVSIAATPPSPVANSNTPSYINRNARQAAGNTSTTHVATPTPLIRSDVRRISIRPPQDRNNVAH